MSHLATRVIRDEHAALAAMLQSMPLLLARGTPDFGVLRAMLFYVDEFPEQRHHRKESALLFPMLRRRTADATTMLDRLDAEHAQGTRRVRDLEHALLAYEMLGESRRQAFETALRGYLDFYLAHMALEEQQVLPLAERVLTPQDWDELDHAFAANRDPLTGHEPEQEYRALFSRIVAAAPAPVGLGQPRR